ncbi:hypothetical protein [Deinococcus multiflagellatus]|uniref:Uncharacterized protein n=1 Tax=Deinococcus multiflagellatus TaxID=1656887 RepID=A0ABW1ZMG0_9DEIO
MGGLRPLLQAPKPEWRRWAREVRAGLPDRSGAITAHLRAFLRSHGARRVLAYRALAGEPDLAALADEFELLTPAPAFARSPT